MIVDDKADIRLALRIALSARGFKVIEAASGEEALEKVRTEAVPDIVLICPAWVDFTPVARSRPALLRG